MSIPIVREGVTVEDIRRALREAPLVALREKLTDEEILEACRAEARSAKAGRLQLQLVRDQLVPPLEASDQPASTQAEALQESAEATDSNRGRES